MTRFWKYRATNVC